MKMMSGWMVSSQSLEMWDEAHSQQWADKTDPRLWRSAFVRSLSLVWDAEVCDEFVREYLGLDWIGLLKFCMQLILVLVAMISLSRAFVLSASGSRRSPLRMASLLSAMSTSSGSEHSSNSAPFNSLSNIAVSASDGWSLSGELLVVPFYKAPKDVKGDEAIAAHLKTKIPSQLPSDIQEIVSSVIEDGQFKADAASKQVVRVTGSSVKHIALVGLGSADTTASEDFGTSQTKGSDLEVKVVSKFGRNLATIAKSTKAKSMSIVCPASLGKGGLSQMLIAFYDALYIDHRFKKPSETLKKPEIAQMTLIGCDANVAQDAELVNLLSRKIADGVVWAKDLVGAPPNYKTPIFIAEAAKQMASDLGLECKVLGEVSGAAITEAGYSE